MRLNPIAAKRAAVNATTIQIMDAQVRAVDSRVKWPTNGREQRYAA
jgi:hypothetical protein